jgi:RNA polymerase sigma factor (sigma-70 family)
MAQSAGLSTIASCWAVGRSDGTNGPVLQSHRRIASRPSTAAETTAEFERLRPRLLQVAAGLLKNTSDAEDVVQEAWLRLQRADRAEIRNLRGWLTTTVVRLSLDLLDSAPRRHEYPGGAGVGADVPHPAEDELPANRVALDDLVAWSLRRILGMLSPAERPPFLLHDVFGFSFREIAEAVGRTPEACRQLAARGRRRVLAGAPRSLMTADQEARMIQACVVACTGGDIADLLQALDPGVAACPKEVGNSPHAAEAGIAVVNAPEMRELSASSHLAHKLGGHHFGA